jgi:hypothetical protein
MLLALAMANLGSIGRREFVAGVNLYAIARPPSASAASRDVLEARLEPLHLGSILLPPRVPELAPPELEYPQWLLGLWRATVSFEGFSAPLGALFVEADEIASASASADARVGDALHYPVRYVRAAAGGRDRVRQDRPFNAIAELTAFGALDTDSEIVSAAFDEPTDTLEIVIAPKRAPRLVSDTTRLLLRTLASHAEQGSAGTWVTSELFEQRLLDGLGRPLLPPTRLETIVAFEPPASPGLEIKVRNRICKYAPIGSFAARMSGGAVVATFDYTWTLDRLADSDQLSLSGDAGLGAGGRRQELD